MEINKIKIAIVRQIRGIQWRYTAMMLKYKSPIENARIGFESKQKLILIPHADDEWIGCSRVILNDNTSILFDMDMSGNDSDQQHILRKKELKKVALETGCVYKCISIYDKVKSLIEIIENRKPYYIFLPYYYDWHSEHIDVMRILKEALSTTCYNCKIAMYQVSLPMISRHITNYYPMCKEECEGKWRFFNKQYVTQKYLPTIRFASHEYINGGLFSCYSAEVFSVVESKDWCSRVDRLIMSEQERKVALKNINNIKNIRTIINEIDDRNVSKEFEY